MNGPNAYLDADVKTEANGIMPWQRYGFLGLVNNQLQALQQTAMILPRAIRPMASCMKDEVIFSMQGTIS